MAAPSVARKSSVPSSVPTQKDFSALMPNSSMSVKSPSIKSTADQPGNVHRADLVNRKRYPYGSRTPADSWFAIGFSERLSEPTTYRTGKGPLVMKRPMSSSDDVCVFDFAMCRVFRSICILV